MLASAPTSLQNSRYLVGLQHHLGHDVVRRARLHRAGPDLALLTGGIDLSVGPLAGFLVVVGSFFLNDGSRRRP